MRELALRPAVWPRGFEVRFSLGAVAQIWVLNDCGNLYLKLATF